MGAPLPPCCTLIVYDRRSGGTTVQQVPTKCCCVLEQDVSGLPMIGAPAAITWQLMEALFQEVANPNCTLVAP